MKKVSLILAIAITGFLGSCSHSGNDSVDQAKEVNADKDSSNAVEAMDKEDANFMVDAANASMMEVELGNLAQQKSTNGMVKNYGMMMTRDHTKANDELKSLASSKNVTLPAMPSEDAQKHYMAMSEKASKDFDKDYIDMMVNDHKDVISKFEHTAEKGKDSDLRTWASNTLMTLRMHLDSAQIIQKKMTDKK